MDFVSAAACAYIPLPRLQNAEVFGTGKLADELGWRPKETFETGLRKTVEWYLANSEWVQGVQSGAYRDWVSTQYAKA